jgi:hypothetical protein
VVESDCKAELAKDFPDGAIFLCLHRGSADYAAYMATIECENDDRFPLRNHSGKDRAAARRRCALAGALARTIREPGRPDLAALNAATDGEVAREEAITRAAGIPNPVAF